MKQKHQPGFCIFNSVVAKIILRLLGYPVETYHVILFPKQKEVLDDTIVENYFSFHSVNVLFLSDSKKFIFDTSLDEQTKDEDMIIYEQVNTYKDTILAQLVWLIYDMRYMQYQMFGVFEKTELITFAGVAVQTTLKDKRHLRVFDFITSNLYDSVKYDKIMKDYLEDYAKVAMCEKVKYED